MFVTHLYAPDESYFRVFEYLESQPNFFYKNLATPDKPPRSKEKEAIREDLRRQMTDAEVVVVLSSLYLRDPTSIEYQCLYAQSCDKPLVVLEPFGSTETGAGEAARDGGRSRALERAGDGRCDPSPGASRRYDALGRDRIQARLTLMSVGTRDEPVSPADRV